MSASTESFEIKLLGQRIPLKNSTSSMNPELTREVVELVSARLAQVEERVKNTVKGAVAPHQVALLALFDLAEEHVATMRKVETRSEEIIGLIDAELK